MRQCIWSPLSNQILPVLMWKSLVHPKIEHALKMWQYGHSIKHIMNDCYQVSALWLIVLLSLDDSFTLPPQLCNILRLDPFKAYWFDFMHIIICNYDILWENFIPSPNEDNLYQINSHNLTMISKSATYYW